MQQIQENSEKNFEKEPIVDIYNDLYRISSNLRVLKDGIKNGGSAEEDRVWIDITLHLTEQNITTLKDVLNLIEELFDLKDEIPTILR